LQLKRLVIKEKAMQIGGKRGNRVEVRGGGKVFYRTGETYVAT